MARSWRVRIERQQGKQGEAEADQPQTDQKERQVVWTDPQAGDGHELAVAPAEPTKGEQGKPHQQKNRTDGDMGPHWCQMTELVSV